MIETLFNAGGQDQTRVRRAFNWVITFRDFPAGVWQTVDSASMISEALTLFTKGRAEFYLDGVRRGDRLPGILSSEHDLVGLNGTFKLIYVEPTTRVCIPAFINRGKLPMVTKHLLKEGELFEADGKYLVALGSVSVTQKLFKEEQTFQTKKRVLAMALKPVILLEFHD